MRSQGWLIHGSVGVDDYAADYVVVSLLFCAGVDSVFAVLQLLLLCLLASPCLVNFV